MAVQVKLKTVKHHAWGVWRKPGDVYSVDADTAKAIVAKGNAEYVKPSKKEAEKEKAEDNKQS